MTSPPTVHKYAGDDPTATRTACGLTIYNRYTGYTRHVDADARKTNCGNCGRTAKAEEPLLGLATTKELLVELECRFRLDQYKADGGSPEAIIAAHKCRVMLAALPQDVLNERTAATGKKTTP